MPAARFAIQPLASFAPQAWRNGGGTTRALAEQEGWRISLADVARNGPYSRFAGMTRVSLVVEGAGVTLDDGPTRVELLPARASLYEGDAAWHATLRDGPVVKLNAMVERGRYTARIVPLFDATHVPSGCFALVMTLRGASVVRPTHDAMHEATNDATSVTLGEAHVLTRHADGDAFHLSSLHDTQHETDDTAQTPYAALVIIETAARG